MLIVRLIRYIVGYVGFEAAGGFPERFVNLCAKNGIPLWNMKNFGGKITAETTASGYKKIRLPAKRSGARVRLTEKNGLPFFLRKNKSRGGFIIGMVAAAVIVVYLSGGIWNVTVTGNKAVSEERVREVFSSLGVYTGARKSKIDVSAAADEAAKIIDEIAWASVNIKGSRAEIVITERTKAPEFPDESTPCNIIASQDGIITEIEAEIGEAAVMPGDAALKGEVLISGVTENLDKSEKLVSARGNVYASVSEKIITSADGTFLRETEKKENKTLFFFGLNIPLGFSKIGEDAYSEKSFLSDGEITLPIGIISARSHTSGNETGLPDENKSLYSAKEYADKYKELYENAEITNASVSVSRDGGFACLTGEYECKKEIGVRQEIFVENN